MNDGRKLSQGLEGMEKVQKDLVFKKESFELKKYYNRRSSRLHFFSFGK